MTLWLVLTWSCIRTAIVATLAVCLGQCLVHQINRCASRSIRRVWLIAALIPLLIPELIVGFTYRLTAQHLTDSVWGTELLYGAILLVRSCAVSTLILLLLPRSSVTAESVHSWNLVQRHGLQARWNYLRLLVTGPWRSTVAAWCLTALVTFQDFETAALVQVDRHPIVWTVWLFDANAGNQLLSYTLRLVIAPVIIELLLLIPSLLLIARHSDVAISPPAIPKPTGAATHAGRRIAAVCTMAGIGLVAGGPLFVSLPELAAGITTLTGDMTAIARQQLATFGFSASAALVAMSMAVLLRRWNHKVLTCLCLLPGLAGSLAVSLALLWLFQRPGLVMLWDTWLPLLAGQVLFLLPRAWVLLLILEATVSTESLQSARLLLTGGEKHRASAWKLLWTLSHVKWLAAMVVLCHWCTWDVTTASILRPVTIEPVVTRLYREMHFSRTESLTALSVVTLVFPLAMAATTMLAVRSGYRRWSNK